MQRLPARQALQIRMEPDGFCIIPNVFAADECAILLGGLASTRHTRAGARNVLSDPRIARAAHDPRLVGIASEALGAGAVPFRATLFHKSARSNWLVTWHQDSVLPLARRFEAPDWGPWSVKQGVLCARAPAWALDRVVALRLHLDPSHAHNGPLRVIPGSHRLGRLADAQVASLVGEQEAHDCLVSRGGVLAMRPLIVHASSKATSNDPRRVLHIEYAESLSLSDEATLAAAAPAGE